MLIMSFNQSTLVLSYLERSAWQWFVSLYSELVCGTEKSIQFPLSSCVIMKGEKLVKTVKTQDVTLFSFKNSEILLISIYLLVFSLSEKLKCNTVMNRSWEKIRVRLFVRLGEEMSEVPLDLFVKKRDRPSLLEVASVSFLCKCYSLRVLQGIIDMHCFFLSNSE